METSGSDTILVISAVGGAAEEKRPERGFGGKLVNSVVHGVSVSVLVEMDNVASAIVLQRAQFEAVVRALWLDGVATDAWLERHFAADFHPNARSRCCATPTACPAWPPR